MRTLSRTVEDGSSLPSFSLQDENIMEKKKRKNLEKMKKRKI